MRGELSPRLLPRVLYSGSKWRPLVCGGDGDISNKCFGFRISGKLKEFSMFVDKSVLKAKELLNDIPGLGLAR